ncbi:MAG: N,N-dimethylformamidase [Rhodobacteraceae bacterium]|nr:MAG: N,N-dimethylformamidase [Paracoccaceae bacterium]
MKKILGYCDDWSAVAGGRVAFKIGAYGPDRFEAALVRVVCGDDHPDRGLFHEEEIDAPFNGWHAAAAQPIDAGSRVIVPEAPALAGLESFTVQAWVFPTTPLKGEQGLVTQWRDDPATGFALMIDACGAAALRVGDGAGRVAAVSTGAPLAERRWWLVSAWVDAASGRIGVRQTPGATPLERHEATESAADGVFAPAPAPLVFAAFTPPRVGGSARCFNGKIDRPRLCAGVRSTAEVDALASSPAPTSAHEGVVGAWDFAQGIGTREVRDTGPNALHGETVNAPSRGCKGHNWSGREQNFAHAPQEYGAIHFHEDDLHDAGWETSFAYDIPPDLPSGVYAARLRADGDQSYVPFFVRPPKGRTTAKLAFLASTLTYLAYANYHWHHHEPFAEATEGFWTTLEPTDVFLQAHPEFGLSTYDTHADGSGVRFSSRLRPILNMAPRTPLWSFNADTHILGWLESQGIAYDVLTDEDLHREGAAALAPYRAVLTGSHPEYYTTPMMEGLQRYIADRGRLVYLGGNGFIWRCAVSDAMPGLLELRRAEDGIRYRGEEPGEYHLELTGEYGGLWRRLGLPPQALVGVGTVAVGFDRSGFFRRTADSEDPRAAFIFEGIGRDEIIGDFGFVGGGAAGSEIDATDPVLGTPAHALVVARSEGHSANTLLCPDEIGFTNTVMDGVQNPRVRADMTFFETPGGGAVFSVGSIAWAGSLPHHGYDNTVSRLTLNVLRRFLDETPFDMPPT